MRIGLCEDDPDLRSLLERALRAEGFEVRATITGHQAVEAFSAAPPDLLVLDVGLPDADGRDVCQALRGHGVTVPVIFLTARDALPDRLAGFHAGGDDYLTKPFALAELLVRIRALLRRAVPPSPRGDDALWLDPAAHAARAGERSAQLTPTEFRLLAALVARPREVLRRRELVAAAWPEGAIVHDNTLDAYAGRLRRKLATLGAEQRIETVRGVGWVLR
ncbi:response regulator transcription factor [Conexibacter sp. JD483]|uniref:response regulator transcription factor n=1 Tax=unclassified Conexibacter TaxID=2627773 RepID=UPI0027180685|nr:MULTISPECIES: response regulator transcription factor [unclassified Conexibacter]MDO8186070.1 response regulator transcription factor [Conexibacter sp. CPCC 205706]MDO8199560.1 response regulator transcription factor [Conexibacter sp. CPCC 205762]MDR9372416.1 response regulator transcription factor [Conexibacter sp. JD483]